MATITKQLLSGATSGRNIKVGATATPGTLIHTAHATDKDEVWLWVQNADGSDRKITFEFGGVTAPDDLIEYTVPAEDGPHLVVPGLVLTGGVAVRAFAAAADVLLVNGYVNRITE